MTLPVLALYISLEGVVMLLLWAAFAAMAYWAWSASKAQAAMMTMAGAGLIALITLLNMFGVFIAGLWPMFVGIALVAYGYYLTVKPTIDANIAKLKEKAKAATHSGGSGTPPAAS
ncbi:MAG: hypothetical protein U1E39_02390 [Planctomycetota bacterium]